MTVQISAHIPEHLKERLDRHARAHGVSRARLVEEALDHHLQALAELPAEVLVPSRVVLTQDSAEHVRELLTRPPEPTEAMRELFDDR